MLVVRMLFQSVVGGAVGFVVYFVSAPMLIGIGLGNQPWLIGVSAGLCAAILGYAPTLRRALGRGFLLIGSAFLLLPFGAFFMAGRAFNDTVGDKTDAASIIGAGGGAALVTGIGTIVGLILGLLCLVIGLVLALGGRREVIVINQRDGRV